METLETWVLAFPSFWGSAISILCLFPGVCPLPW